jgi:hypothetical protein
MGATFYDVLCFDLSEPSKTQKNKIKMKIKKQTGGDGVPCGNKRNCAEILYLFPTCFYGISPTFL